MKKYRSWRYQHKPENIGKAERKLKALIYQKIKYWTDRGFSRWSAQMRARHELQLAHNIMRWKNNE